jgi:hypothetical protein
MSQQTAVRLFSTPLLFALLVGVLAACGGGSGAPDPKPDPVNQVRTRLVACPVVDQSSDPTASTCLAGTYLGKTLANADCKLVIEASGNYQFTSPALSYNYVATLNTIRVFSHQNAAGQHQILWLMNDPVQRGDAFDLKFSYADGLGKKLEMEGTKRLEAGGRVSATCTAFLN